MFRVKSDDACSLSSIEQGKNGVLGEHKNSGAGADGETQTMHSLDESYTGFL